MPGACELKNPKSGSIIDENYACKNKVGKNFDKQTKRSKLSLCLSLHDRPANLREHHATKAPATSWLLSTDGMAAAPGTHHISDKTHSGAGGSAGTRKEAAVLSPKGRARARASDSPRKCRTKTGAGAGRAP